MPSGGSWYRWRDNALELRVQAKTRAREEGLGEAAEDAVPVRVNAPPVDGKANRRLLAIVADAFGVAASRVKLVRGTRSKYKWVRIEYPARIPKPLKSRIEIPFEVDQSRKGD